MTKIILRWRSSLTKIAATIILGLLLFLAWQQRATISAAIVALGGIGVLVMGGILLLSFWVSVFTFTLLVNGMGYRFTFMDGYHSLNLSQIAAMVPGKVWGFAGLAGLLTAKQIPPKDSVLIIMLNLLIMLSACVMVGAVGLIPLMGWAYTIFLLSPVAVLLLRRDWLERLRHRFFPDSSALPETAVMVKTLLAGLISWGAVALSFLWLVYRVTGHWPESPFLVASAIPVGYIAGFISLIAPSGIGVSEGVTTILLSPSLGREQALSLAIVFRVVHTAVIWLNIAVSLSFFMLSKPKNEKKPGQQAVQPDKLEHDR